MAHTIAAKVSNNRLTSETEQLTATIEIGSEAWYRWLGEATNFAFEGQNGKFSAHKIPSQRGSYYWKAYRYHHGKRLVGYLGKDRELTTAKLEQVASELNRQTQTAAPVKNTQNKRVQKAVAVDQPFEVGKPTPPSSVITNQTLFATKVQKPLVLAHRQVRRPDLLARLEQIEQYKLILVSAGPGNGKTSLVAGWLAESNFPAAWFSLDPEDNDPVRFWQYLTHALDQTCPGLEVKVAPLFQSLAMSQLVATMINYLTNLVQDTLLVIDDYHLINNLAIHQSMQLLLEHLPPQLHLVIITRLDPPWPLGKLRATGNLLELRSDNLRFNTKETAIFLRELMQLDLSDELVSILAERTEGWVVGVQLAALGIQGTDDRAGFVSAFKGSHRFVFDYLAEEVLERQNPPIRNFLLQTSILQHLNAGVVEAITGCEDGQAMLKGLEAANLFIIPLDSERQWYRYHHLFGDYLRTRLVEEQPEHVALLHRWAAAWYEGRGMLATAIDHYLEAKDFEKAATLIEQVDTSYRVRGELFTLQKWFEAIPEEIFLVRPTLNFGYIWLLSHLTQIDMAERRLNKLLEVVGVADVTKIEESTLDKGLQQEIIVLQGQMAFQQGRYYQAVTLFEKILLSGNHQFDLRAILVGQIYYELNQLEKAEYYWEMAAEAAKRHPAAGYDFVAQVLLARVKLRRGDRTGLAKTLLALEQVKRPYQPGVQRLEFAWAGLVWFWLIKGETAKAIEWADQVQLIDFSRPINSISGWQYSMLARVWLKQGKTTEAINLLETVYALSQQYDVKIYLLVAQTHALYSAGQLPQALAKLAEVLQLTQAEGWLRVYIDEGEVIETVLKQLRPTVTDVRLKEYIERLMANFGENNNTLAASEKPAKPVLTKNIVTKPIEPLTERERQVLKLLATGLSSSDVADTLNVATSTARTHIKNIYSKLAVQNRT